MTTENPEKILLASMAENIHELNQYIRSLEKLLHDPEAQASGQFGVNLAAGLQNREKRLQEAILDAVNELEESRKSFKSKRLEQLRKRLTQALLES